MLRVKTTERISFEELKEILKSTQNDVYQNNQALEDVSNSYLSPAPVQSRNEKDLS